METLNLVQGTDEWLVARLEYFTASEAPAMMNQSKYMSRNQLLDLKKGWQKNPDDSFKKALYQQGHESESAARPIIEKIIGEDLFPVTGKVIVSGLELLASFDGILMDHSLNWEHKEYNEILAENVRNESLEPHYYWQLEHQMLVSDTKKCHFTVSNGTSEKMVSMHYHSNPERRLELIAGWFQFRTDLDNHELKAKIEKVEGQKAEMFPLVEYEVKGTELISNATQYLELIRTKSQIELDRVLETDQDFADKDLLNKAVITARKELKTIVSKAQGEFKSFADFAATAKEIDSVLQKMQSHGEKQVKEGKQIKKDNIVSGAITEVVNHIQEIDKTISPVQLNTLIDCSLNYDLAMKGKRTIESIQNAVDFVVADFKIKSNEVANKVKQNLVTLDEFPRKYDFLFADKPLLVTKANDDLIAVIKTRIADYEQAEKIKSQELREKIRIEEEAKAEKKIKNEQFAVQQKKDAEKAGELAKRTVEKREEEFVNTSSGEVVSGIDPDNAKQETEQDTELTLYNKIAVWGLSHKVSTVAMIELEIILGMH